MPICGASYNALLLPRISLHLDGLQIFGAHTLPLSSRRFACAPGVARRVQRAAKLGLQSARLPVDALPSARPAASTLTTRIMSLLIIDLPWCEK